MIRFRTTTERWLRRPAAWGALIGLLFLGLNFPSAETAVFGEPQRLVFGTYVHIRSTDMLEKLVPFQRYLQEALRSKGFAIEIELRLYATYGEGIHALSTGDLDLSRLGPVSYVLAKEKNPGIRLLAMESNEGRKRFNGVISVAENSPIRTVEDLRGKTLAFGDRRSTTGRFLSQAALVGAGIRATDLASYAYLGRHDKVAFAVAAGNYDAGASNENTFNKYAREKGLRKILEFPCVTKPWVARAGLDERLFQAVREALLELRDPEVLESISRSGFLAADDSDYDLIREGMIQAREFDTEGVNFGVYPSEKPSEVYNIVKPALDLLESSLAEEESPERFRIKFFPSSQDGIDGLIRGDVDLARIGASSYVLAKRLNPHIRLLVREGLSDSAMQEGVFVVPEGSGVRTLADLRGRTLAFGDSNSTAGRFAAQAELLRAGIHAKDLKSFSYLGRHDRVAYAVAAGNYDAGVLRSGVLDDKEISGKLRVVGRFKVPRNVWVAREGLDADLFDTVQRALLGMGTNGTELTSEIDGFSPAEDGEYDGIRESMGFARTFE